MAVTQLLEPLMDTLEGIRMPTRFIHLDRMPRDEEGVAELHQALQKCQDGPLADGWGEVSHWSAERMEAGDWGLRPSGGRLNLPKRHGVTRITKI